MANCIMLVGKIKEFIKINNAVQIKIEIVRNEEKKDLIPIVAFDRLGEEIAKNCREESLIGVKGKIQNNNDNLEIIAEKISFLQSRAL